jgi:hypothetical protein
LVHLKTTLEQEHSGRGDVGVARRKAHDAYHRINNNEGDEQPPPFAGLVRILLQQQSSSRQC